MSNIIQADLSKQSYAFAVPCYDGNVRIETMAGLLGTSMELSKRGIGHSFLTIKGGALIHNVRNELVHKFLHQTDCTTMVWVDADIGFDFAAFERLAVFSSMYPIVAGAYPSRTDPPTFFVNYTDNKLNEHGLLPVDGTGMGFVAIRREVFEKMKVRQYRSKAYELPLKAFFQMGYEDTDEVYEGQKVERSQGEDIWFFKEAARQGIPSYIDPYINLTHTGPKTFDSKLSECVGQILNQ